MRRSDEKDETEQPEADSPLEEAKAPTPAELAADKEEGRRLDQAELQHSDAQVRRQNQAVEQAFAEHGTPGQPTARPNDYLPTAPGNPHGHTEAEFPKGTHSPPLWENRETKPSRFDVEPVEADLSLLAKLQDPYDERRPQPVPTVVVKDSYGNLVTMPV